MEHDENSEEKDVIGQLDLSDEQIEGVNKFLEAFSLKAKDLTEINEALDAKFYLPLDKEPKNRTQEQALYHTLQEFFSCFMVLGYDLEGNDTFYHYAPNQLTFTALNKKLFEVASQKHIEESGLMGIFNGNASDDGEDMYID